MNVKGKTNKDIWQKIKIGDSASFKTIIRKDKVADFVSLSGDKNPLHSDKKIAKIRGFEKPISHGMLLASYFSTLVGMHFLKDHNLYLSQIINFMKPVFVGETIIVKGKIINKMESLRILEVETVIINKKGEEVVKGIASVKYI
ncbi:MAG: MaoC family dehydratase [Nanoarchaeota archaeon]